MGLKRQIQARGDDSVGNMIALQPGGPEFSPQHYLKMWQCMPVTLVRRAEAGEPQGNTGRTAEPKQ